MYVVYINLLYFLSIFLFTYNKNLLSQKRKMDCLNPQTFQRRCYIWAGLVSSLSIYLFTYATLI